MYKQEQARVCASMRAWLAAALALVGVPAMAQQPQVKSTSGVIEGRASAVKAVIAYKGVPYAAPPVGDLRWKPPADPAPWAGARTAIDFAPACMQTEGPPTGFYTDNPPRTSEDCLYLNVWAPANAHNAPVMVWYHGGSLVFGTAMNQRYDGAKLAEKGVIVVSVNYRLGVLGYFSHPELTAESPHHSSGNYGLLDQIASLRWVQKNIAAFGGDPKRVTIFGQSAGALSVTYLMSSPLADGLFQNAIAQSAYMPAMPELRRARYGLAPAESKGVEFGQQNGAATLAALRAVPAKKLVEVASSSYSRNGDVTAVVDGWVLPQQVFEAFEKGREAKVPLIIGFTSGEPDALDPGALPPFPTTSADYTARVKAVYGDLAPEFLRLYPAKTPTPSSLVAYRDGFYGWAVQKLARLHASNQPKTWLYYFDHTYPSQIARGLGAYHSSDVPFVFGNVGPGAIAPINWPNPPSRPEDIAMSQIEMGYWTAFAKAGQPTAKGQPKWAPFNAAKQSHMAFRNGQAIPSQYPAPGSFELQDSYMARLRKAEAAPWTNANLGVGGPLNETNR